MLGRIKHLLSLIVLAAMLITVLLLNVVLTNFTAISLDGTDAEEDVDNAVVEIIAKNGAAATYEIKDGKIIFDVTALGSVPSDLQARITIPSIKYDSTALKERLGGAAEENADLISKMEKGPWYGQFGFTLDGEGNARKRYTIFDETYNKISSRINSKEHLYTEQKVIRPDGFTFTVMFGASKMLEPGKYTFSLDMELMKPVDDTGNVSAKLPISTKTRILYNTVRESLTLENIKQTLAAKPVFTLIIELYLATLAIFCAWDFYSAGAIASSILANDDLTEAVMSLFKRGYAFRANDGYGRAGFVKKWIYLIVSYLILAIILPLRLVIKVLCDLLCILIGDEQQYHTVIWHNLIGIIGLALFILGILASYGSILLFVFLGIILGVMTLTAMMICFSFHDTDEHMWY